MGNLLDFFKRIIQGMQGSYAFNLLGKAFVRLRTAVMNPFRRGVRRVQQIFNANLITAKLVAPINTKIRKIMSGEPKSPEDYFSIGRFWISKALVYIIILGACAFVFIYFNWIAPPVADTMVVENLITSVYYDYDDMDLGEYTGKANIRAANGEVVYTGDIVAGVCTGMGTLWNQDGVLIYTGQFSNNNLEGNGTLYYPSGKPRYTGEFKENNFSGKGVLYYTDGNIEYDGEFENGAFNGKGICYNEKGVMIYEGEFQSGAYHGQGTSFYSSGIKKYEGEYYMGRAQGVGSLYSSTGKLVFKGNFARDDIHYEALLGCNIKETTEMFDEKPIIYYTDGEVSFLYERAQVILKADCLLEVQAATQDKVNVDNWYLSGEDGETLPETDASRLEEEVATSEMANLPVVNDYNVYIYLPTDEWQEESKADFSAINVTGVSSYREAVTTGFLEEESMTPENGAAALQECVAIDRIRLMNPTAFSNINYELTSMNRTHIAVSGINLAEAIYEEVYELDGVRYRLCYEMYNPNELMFVTYENY